MNRTSLHLGWKWYLVNNLTTPDGERSFFPYHLEKYVFN